jgi:hypothetical protein
MELYLEVVVHRVLLELLDLVLLERLDYHQQQQHPELLDLMVHTLERLVLLEVVVVVVRLEHHSTE